MSDPSVEEIVVKIEVWIVRCTDPIVEDVDALISSWRERGEALKELQDASSVLLDEAEGFNVSGVYFNEPCMGHKGPSLVRAACDRARAALGLDGASMSEPSTQKEPRS